MAGAIRCAFWRAFRLINASEHTEANAWIARLGRLVAATSGDLAAARLEYLTGLRAAFEGDLTTAALDLERAAAAATHHQDEELGALARLALGRVRILLGQVTAGFRLLDDAMLVVGSEPISPIAVGDRYCTAIDACHELYDVRRGQAWTDGLSRWCDEQPDLVPFAARARSTAPSSCSSKAPGWRRWPRPVLHASASRCRSGNSRTALRPTSKGNSPLVRRLDKAETCYRAANGAGRDPQPGLALLRLRQGRAVDAARAIDRAMAEAGLRSAGPHSWRRTSRSCWPRTAWPKPGPRLRISPTSRTRSSPPCSPPPRIAQPAGSSSLTTTRAAPLPTCVGPVTAFEARGAVRGRVYRAVDRHRACRTR